MVFKGILWRNVKANISVTRLFSTHVNNNFLVECLKNRNLLRISGSEVEDYVQGLITNDVKHISEGSPCMYTMFLNSKGRVLYDTIIYKSNDNETLLIECDVSASNQLKKHLMTYRVRRKISIELLEDRFSVWVVCNKNAFQASYSKNEVMTTVNLLKKSFSNCLVCSDPRIANLGVRIVAPCELKLSDMLSKIQDSEAAPINFYKTLRYKLGIGEGVMELPPGQCFPLEANCDYLHGVSFHKGCYIGQELTARTYHTGVIRKRLMPIVFDEEVVSNEIDVPILLTNNLDKKIGKLKGVEGKVGIGLLRIEEALKSGQFKILGKTSTTSRPFWWPTEFQKENIKFRTL